MEVVLAAQIVAHWTNEEARAFFESFSRNGRDWACIAGDIRTKTADQARCYYESLLLIIRHLLGQLDFPFDFGEPHDCFLALVTYYGLVAEANLIPFSPEFNAQMLQRIRKQKLGFLQMKQSRAVTARSRNTKLSLRLVPRESLLAAHLRLAKLTPFLKLTVARAKPMASIVLHVAKKWAVLTHASTGTLFANGKWRIYPPNMATHFGWGENDTRATIGDVFEALGRPDDFCMVYHCSMKPRITPTLVSAQPPASTSQVNSPSVKQEISCLPLEALGVSSSPAVPKSTRGKKSQKRQVKSQPRQPSVDAQGNLFGRFHIGKRHSKSSISEAISPSINESIPSPSVTPKQEEMKTVFEEPAQHDSGHDQWTNTDMLGNVYDDAEHHFSESNALATDLDVLNEVSLSTLLLQNETFNFGTLSQPPSYDSGMSFFQQAVNSNDGNETAEAPALAPGSSAMSIADNAEPMASAAHSTVPAQSIPHTSTSHLVTSSRNQSNLDALFDDSLGFPSFSRGAHSTALGAMGSVQSNSLFDFGFSLGGSNSNSGEGFSANITGKKRLFSDISNGPSMGLGSVDDESLKEFASSSGFVPFGGSPAAQEVNKRPRTVFD